MSIKVKKVSKIYGANKASNITVVTITNPSTESGFRLYL